MRTAECNVSVSKLLGFETSRFRNFSIFLVVSDSVSKNLVSKKVSDSVSEKFGIGKSFGFGIVQILGIVTHWYKLLPPPKELLLQMNATQLDW